ncbi:hypothetical protein CFD26_103055 [Aspergillus turcosus]|uniref:Uncharacterized protein n=1 Tax=Aspergillus turcosus TaxID=1245748 RepID=A0A3R7GBV1_9EURO|nr:hypothetical protein CFD26_103055 [Aspergillus turcosus]
METDDFAAALPNNARIPRPEWPESHFMEVGTWNADACWWRSIPYYFRKHPLNVGADKIPTDMPLVVETWLEDVQDQFTFEMG